MGEISDAKAGLLVARLGYLDRIGEGDGVLHVEIDSDGGDIAAAHRIADAIATWRGPSFARVRRRCESAALLVLGACRHRAADEGAAFLLHEPFDPQPGREHLTPATCRNLDRAADHLALRMARAFGRPFAQVRQAMMEETRLNAFEAKRWGLVRVVLPTRFAGPAPGGGVRKLQSAWP